MNSVALVAVPTAYQCLSCGTNPFVRKKQSDTINTTGNPKGDIAMEKNKNGNVTGRVAREIFSHVAWKVAEASQGTIVPEEVALSYTPSRDLGDLTVRCFDLAARLKQKPSEVATLLARAIKPDELIEGSTPVGPYLNVFLKREAVASMVLRAVFEESDQYGNSDGYSGEVTMMEYVSPNTNKPLHLGHIRNGLIGWSVAELVASQGSRVFKTDIINDRGIHIMKSMLAYMRWGNGETPESTNTKGDHFVGHYYVLFEKEFQKEKTEWLNNVVGNGTELSADQKEKLEDEFTKASSLMNEIRELLRKWEACDGEVRNLWQRMNNWVYRGFEETYRKLGIDFARHYYESEIFEGGKEVILEALGRGLFERAQNGAVAAPLSKHPELFPRNPLNPKKVIPLTDKVVLRADGTGLYVTQDINLATIKFRDFGLTRSIYCIGSEQDYYMQQLFAIMKLLEFEWAEGLYHLSYGMVYLPEGKMKSREGRVVDADELVDSVVELARSTLKDRYPEIGDKELESRAWTIGLSAIKFHFLSVGKNSPIYFDPKASLSFEGRTGPYLQYSYARASSILRKVGGIPNLPSAIKVSDDSEWQIVTDILDFPRTLSEAAQNLDPAKLANYLADLAQRFNGFYHTNPVIGAGEEEVRQSRLAVTVAFRAVIKRGLSLLGIGVLEEM